MPSDIVVTSPATFEENLAENAKEIFCNASFQAGALALGGALFFTPIPEEIPLLAIAGGIGAMGYCPAKPDPEKILGGPPPFTGGQCVGVLYRPSFSFQYYTDSTGNNTSTSSSQFAQTGPVTLENTLRVGLQNTVNEGTLVFNDIIRAYDGFGIVEGTLTISVPTYDGSPDVCGNPPGDPPGQVIVNVEEGDTINQDTVVDNSNKTYSVPVHVDIGDIDNVFNLPFSNPEIKTYIPIRIKLNVGGVDLDFGPKVDSEDWEVKNSGKPLSDAINKNQDKLLRLIRECVCKPNVELDALALPYVNEIDDDCIESTINLLAARGTYPPTIVSVFEQSKELAIEGCEDETPNEPRSLLLSGTSTDGSQIFTTGILPDGVKVVEYEVTSFGPDTRIHLADIDGVKQGRFGVLFPGFIDTDDNFYVGEGFAQYYERNLIVVPPELKTNVALRLSAPVGTSFNIWDTGIRF